MAVGQLQAGTSTRPGCAERHRGIARRRAVRGLRPRSRGGRRGRQRRTGNIRYQLSGHRIRQADIGLPGLFASRPFLEGHLRARVAALPNVRISENADVLRLTADAGRVTGVRVFRRAAGEFGDTLDADLVVDAMGRGSRTPLWLNQLAGFEAYAARLAFPDIARALRDAEPLDDPVAFRFPASVRQRYERMRQFPAGLLVIGDAVCSFNPVYGQGMAVAASEAALLRDLLAGGGAPSARTWFRRIARVVDNPWQVAVGADLANPAVSGKRTLQVRMANAYLPRLHAAATSDVSLGRALIRVIAMVDRPQGLLRPDRRSGQSPLARMSSSATWMAALRTSAASYSGLPARNRMPACMVMIAPSARIRLTTSLRSGVSNWLNSAIHSRNRSPISDCRTPLWSCWTKRIAVSRWSMISAYRRTSSRRVCSVEGCSRPQAISSRTSAR